MKNILSIMFGVLMTSTISAQNADIPKVQNPLLYQLKTEVSAEHIESSIENLVSFGTRHTLSDTISSTRGIGAARRWVKSEFDKISADCGGCLEVYYQRTLVEGKEGTRIPEDTYVVNVIAVQKGSADSNAYIMMAGDIDSRISDPLNSVDDSPGANDNASGLAGVIEAARVLSKHKFQNNVAYLALSGEEQGLFGGKHFAEKIKKEGWQVLGVLNNDMIGNIEGVDGIIDNREFRIFSEPTPQTESDRSRRSRRFFGGEIDGNSRQLARYVFETTQQYIPELKPMMVYRLDRFGRGGHHRPFNDLGFAGVRIMEAHENYNRQHQDIRVENGIKYGDVIEKVDFDYAAQLTRVNVLTMARLASAPLGPERVKLRGAVSPSTDFAWTPSKSKDAIGYYIYWRATDSSTWDHRIFVSSSDLSKNDKGEFTYTLEGWVIDNALFGVAAVNAAGDESTVVFPWID